MTQQFYLLFNRNKNMSMKNVHNNFIYDHSELEITQMSINQRKDKLWDVHKKEHNWVAKKYSKLCNKMYESHWHHKQSNIQKWKCTIPFIWNSRTGKVSLSQQKTMKKMVAKGRKGEKFPAHFETMERFSIWVGIREIHICQKW